MAGLPEFANKRFYLRHWFIEFVTGIGVLFGSGSAVALALPIIIYPDEKTANLQSALAWMAIGGAVTALLGSAIRIVQGLHKDARDKDEERMDGLYAALHIAHSLVRHKHDFALKDHHDRLRVTLHRIVPAKKKGEQPTEYQQMFDYIGGSDGKGRRFPIGFGIVGAVIRQEVPLSFSRNNDDFEAYKLELVQKYGFTKKQADAVPIDRNSWMAVPIKYQGKEVTGVLYLDAKDRDFFTDEVQQQVVWACGGFAVFINERYR